MLRYGLPLHIPNDRQLMVRLKIIINCGPCEQYIGQCLESVREQKFSNWQAYVTVDGQRDRTYEKALQARGADYRIRIMRNKRRMFSLWNLIQAVQFSNAAPEDVIVNLDGDDWLARRDALQIIAETYARHDCWVTYGSWISNWVGKDGYRPGLWQAYPEGTVNFRKSRWLGTAVRTFRKWIWDRIDDRDLRDSTGRYYCVSEDQAVMLPLLEMSGTAKACHIPEALMVYNQTNPYSAGLTMAEEMHRNAIHLEKQRPYRRLQITSASPFQHELREVEWHNPTLNS